MHKRAHGLRHLALTITFHAITLKLSAERIVFVTKRRKVRQLTHCQMKGGRKKGGRRKPHRETLVPLLVIPLNHSQRRRAAGKDKKAAGTAGGNPLLLEGEAGGAPRGACRGIIAGRGEEEEKK